MFMSSIYGHMDMFAKFRKCKAINITKRSDLICQL